MPIFPDKRTPEKKRFDNYSSEHFRHKLTVAHCLYHCGFGEPVPRYPRIDARKINNVHHRPSLKINRMFRMLKHKPKHLCGKPKFVVNITQRGKGCKDQWRIIKRMKSLGHLQQI